MSPSEIPLASVPFVREVIARSAFRTLKLSGVIVPEAIASPSPRAAFTTTTSRAPLTGSALKAMAEASAGTMSCTRTAMRGVPVIPRFAR